MSAAQNLIAMLVERGIATIDKKDALKCCGMVRDIDGFCQHRPHHPIFLGQYLFLAWGEEEEIRERW